jgi:hypothetical protein
VHAPISGDLHEGLRRCGRFGEREPVSIEKENIYLDASHQGVENLRFIFLRPPLSFESVFVELTLWLKYKIKFNEKPFEALGQI